MAISRPIVAALALAIVAGAWVFLGDSSTPVAAAPPRKHTTAKADADWDLPAPDPNLRFAHLGGVPRNAFVPLVATAKPIAPPKLPPKDQLVAIPAPLAGGEGGWAYTGMVEANGVRMALLENKGSKQTGFVQVGEPWKKAQIVDIETAYVVMADEKGQSETVYRFDPNAPVKPKTGSGGGTPTPGGGGPGSVPGGASPISGPITPMFPGSSGTIVRPFPGGSAPVRRFIQENG